MNAVASGPVALVLTWCWRLAALTGTWWLQVLAGGVVLGLAPATRVLYASLGAELDGEPGDLRLTWALWRRDFWAAQVRLGVPALTVIVIAWYVQALRGTPFAVSVFVLGGLYLCWLVHLPAVIGLAADDDGPGRSATDDWLLTLRLMARRPIAHLLAATGSAAAVVALLFAFPGGLVLAVPGLPALAATLVVRRAAESP